MVALWPVSDATRPGFELSFTVKKSQTTVSMTERYFTLSVVVCVVVRYAWRQRNGN